MHPALRAASERRLGLFTTGDAVRAGYGASEIRALCRSGSWERLRRGVLIEAEILASAGQRIAVTTSTASPCC